MKRSLLPLTLCLLACEAPLPDVRWEGRHVRVAADPELELCGGTLAHMDDFIVRVAAEFGVDPPTGDDRYTYYWLEGDDFGRRTPCPDYVGGCALFDKVYSRAAPLDHELVHSVSFEFGVGPQIFVEGLARSYEGLEAFRGPQPQRPRDIWKFVDANWIAPLDYDVAGAFTSYLIERHGIGDFLAAYEELGAVSRSRAIDRVFRDRFGLSLAESIAEFHQLRGTCLHEHADPKLSECSAPEIAWDGQHVGEFRRLACDQEDVVGPFYGSDTLVLRTLVVPEEGTYDIAVITDEPGLSLAVSLFPCGRCGSDPAITVNVDQRTTTRLGAGLWSLRLHGLARRDVNLGWALTRQPEPDPQ